MVYFFKVSRLLRNPRCISLIFSSVHDGSRDSQHRREHNKNKYVPSAAALINGTLAHSLDFDDTHAEASLHSSAPILAAAFAAAQMKNCSGQELIAACV